MVEYRFRYKVLQTDAAAFEALYGPTGPWVILFSRFAGYKTTQITSRGGGQFDVVDRWAFAVDRDKAVNDPNYKLLDQFCHGVLDIEEEFVGEVSPAFIVRAV